MSETQPSDSLCPSEPTHNGSGSDMTVTDMSSALVKAGKARAIDRYLVPSSKILPLRQGSLYWNDNGACLAVDEDPSKGVVDKWPKRGVRSRTEKHTYSSPQYELIPGKTIDKVTLEPTPLAGEDSHFPSEWAPRRNHIRRITFYFTTAGRSVWQKDDVVPRHFSPKDRSLYQYASSGLLEFELADLTYYSETD